MFDILAITLPIYLCILLGFVSTRQGLFSRADMRTLGKFVIYLGLPALLFNALASRSVSELLHLDYLLLYAVGSLAAGLSGLWWFRRRGQDASASAVFGLGMCSSNSGFVGYPILLLTYPDVAPVVLALNMLVENMLVIPLLMALAERGQGKGRGGWALVRDTARSLATNPLVLGVVAGTIFSVFQWQLPGPVAKTVNLFSLSSAALSLFVIGGSLVGLQARHVLGQIAPIALGKLLLHPALVAGAAALYALSGMGALDEPLRLGAVLVAAMPMMGIYPVLAQRFGREDVAAASLLVTTIASFFTINALIWLQRHS